MVWAKGMLVYTGRGEHLRESVYSAWTKTWVHFKETLSNALSHLAKIKGASGYMGAHGHLPPDNALV